MASRHWTRISASLKSSPVMKIATGTLAGQILTTACVPLLTQLYSPNEFGVFATVSAVCTIIATVTLMRFELAVPVPKDPHEAYALIWIGLSCAGIFAALISAAVALVGSKIAAVLNIEGDRHLLWSVPLVASLTGIAILFNQLAVRDARFSEIGRRNFTQSAVLSSTQIGAGLLGLGGMGLLIGVGLAQLVAAISLAKGAGMRTRNALSAASKTTIRKALRSYYRFPLMLAPAGLINILGLQLVPVLFAIYYGTEVAGWLSFSQRTLALPVALIGIAVAQVYLSKIAIAAQRRNFKEMRQLHTSATLKLALAGVPLLILFGLMGPILFSKLFGQEWATSGIYSQAMVIGIAVQFVSAPLSQTLIVLRREREQLLWDCGRLIAVPGSLFTTAQLELTALQTIWIMSTASAVCYAVLWLLTYRAIRTAEARCQLSPTT